MSACRAASPSATPCVFPGPPRSALAWGTPMTGDTAFRGRVVNIAAVPIVGALVRLDPGNHLTGTDSLGEFRFAGVPRGRYLMVAELIGFVQAADSVTFGEHGVRVLAALAPLEPGLIGCVRLAPP